MSLSFPVKQFEISQTETETNNSKEEYDQKSNEWSFFLNSLECESKIGITAIFLTFYFGES
jgi:hypothetical protein